MVSGRFRPSDNAGGSVPDDSYVTINVAQEGGKVKLYFLVRQLVMELGLTLVIIPDDRQSR